jgi:hypothetical protein
MTVDGPMLRLLGRLASENSIPKRNCNIGMSTTRRGPRQFSVVFYEIPPAGVLETYETTENSQAPSTVAVGEGEGNGVPAGDERREPGAADEGQAAGFPACCRRAAHAIRPRAFGLTARVLAGLAIPRQR